MLKPGPDYETVRRAFRWQVPRHYNIGVDVADRIAVDRPGTTALIDTGPDGTVQEYSFRDLVRLSNRLANALCSLGLKPGDRVGILLPQTPETAISHIACYKAGFIVVPLFTLFGEEALEYRLATSGVAALITSAADLPKIAAIRDMLEALDHVISIDSPPADSPGAVVLAYHDLCAAAADSFRPVDSLAEDPALLIFTSGTTGLPKGALHAHRTLLGHLPGVQFPHEFLPQPGDRFWTPADWAWAGGLLDALLPALHFGIPIAIHRSGKFDPEEAFRMLADHDLRNLFVPPTALKMMRQVSQPRARWNYAVRSIFTGGEATGTELLEWGEEAFGITLNEGYGQTECNLVVGNCAKIMPVKPGSMGRAVPGHDVAVLDAEGNPLPAGETGRIGIRAPDPVMFLGYWNDPEATEAKFAGDWLTTGDIGQQDEDGYLWFVGRDDDLITSAGYRIGPSEIEDCLMGHPAVALAAAIGKPDPIRTEIVKAFIVPAEGVTPDETLAAEIREHVRNRLSAHEYPREVAFVDSLPMTATGKILRRELRAHERELRAQEEAQENQER